MDTKEILQKVRRIEIKTKRLSDHIFSGEYHTAFKGKGMSFAEVRQYQYGDDVRAIDWNVTARYNEPFVKVFEEERELTLMLMVDVSQSVHFGSSDTFKNEFLTEIAATLAFSATNNNDKIGLILFSDEVELFVPPKKGKSHVLRIIRELVQFTPKRTGTDVGKALQFLSQVMKKKAITFVLSDYVVDASSYERVLRIVAKKHDITGIKINDIREKELTDMGLVWFEDAESQMGQYVDTSNADVRTHYTAHFLENQQQFHTAFSKSGAGTISLMTHENYVKKMLAYFKAR